MRKKKRKNNILVDSIKESVKIVKSNKKWIVVLIAAQIIFFMIFTGILLKYSFSILESSKSIIEYVEQQSLDADEIASRALQDQNVLGGDPLLVYREYRNITDSLVWLLVYALLIYIILNGVNWSSALEIIYKHKPGSFNKAMVKFTVITLVYGVIAGVLIGLAAITIPMEFLILFSILPIAIILVTSYFMFASISLIRKNKLKDIPQTTLTICIKKAPILLLVYTINLAMVIIASGIMYLFVEAHIILLSMALFIFTAVFVYARILIITIVKNI